MAGGTGGHIFPGLALYEELKNRKHDLFFIGGERDRRFEAVKKLGNRHLVLPPSPLYRKNIFKNAASLFSFIKAVKRGRALIRSFSPDVVIGMGGYITGPMLMAARMKHVPYVICEQNAYPGFANRRFAHRADKIFLNYERAKDFLPRASREKCLVLGNPARPGFGTVDAEVARKFFGLSAKDFVLGVMGGSQGAASINEAIAGVAAKLKDIKVLWTTGRNTYSRISKQVKRSNIKVFPFVEQMEYFLSACDLVVSRAGATSLTEIAASGVPALLVPYPHATADHQTKNGEVFVSKGAALMVQEGDDFGPRFKEALFSLLENRSRLEGMQKKVASLYKSGTLKKMADIIEKIGEQ